MGLTISPQYAWAGIPTQVTLSSPANGVIIGTTTPTLTWDRIGGNPANQPQTTNGYRILIDNEPTFSAPFTELFQNHPSSGATVSIAAPTLTLGTTYSWKVQGINADGSGTFSAVRTFTVALPAPGLLTPGAGSTETIDETPAFTWNAVTGATSYKIQISNSITGTTNCDPNIAAGTGFTTPIIEQVVSGTSFTPTTNLADGTKHWHVKSISGSIEGCYSASRSVTIDVAPAAPTPVSPANGVFFNDNTPLFNWDDVTDGSGINRYTFH